VKGEITGIAISSFVGGVSYFISMGFTLPPGGEGLKYLATFGAISGFGIGSVLTKRAKSYPLFRLGLASFINLLVGGAAAITYMIMIAVGAIAGALLFAVLAFLLSVAFFCLGLALPLAGLSFSRSSESS
jgi:hypothetical protein